MSLYDGLRVFLPYCQCEKAKPEIHAPMESYELIITLLLASDDIFFRYVPVRRHILIC